jgi:hypothetical protein
LPFLPSRRGRGPRRIAEIARRHPQCRPKARLRAIALLLDRGVEAVAEQVEQDPSYLAAALL